jgi:hypothetical protein
MAEMPDNLFKAKLFLSRLAQTLPDSLGGLTMSKFRFILATCLLCTLKAHAELPLIVQGDSWRYTQAVEQPAGIRGASSVPEFQVLYRTKSNLWVIGVVEARMPVAALITKGKQPIWKIVHLVRPDVCLIDILGGDSLAGSRGCNDLTDGESWVFQINGKEQTETATVSYQGTETVAVPAGVFQALKLFEERVSHPVNSSDPGEEHRFRTTYWYATRVRGMVKVRRDFFAQDGSLSKTLVEELTSFSSSESKSK